MPDWMPESDIDVELVGSFIFANAVMFDCNRVVSIVVSEPRSDVPGIAELECDSGQFTCNLTIKFAGSEELIANGPVSSMSRIVDLFKKWIAENR